MPRETKAQREKRLAAEEEAKAAEATQAPEGGDETPGEGEQPPEPEPQPTVHVLVQRQENGTVEVDVVATGDVRVTEITDILRLALLRWDEKSGLGKAQR
jgi:hypothetical protein